MRGHPPNTDAQTATVSAVVAAGNAALIRHWNFLRSRGQHPVHPAESKPMALSSVSPPTASNTMVVSAAATPDSAAGNDGIMHLGAMLPADVDAIQISMSSTKVDVSSDDSEDGEHGIGDTFNSPSVMVSLDSALQNRL